MPKYLVLLILCSIYTFAEDKYSVFELNSRSCNPVLLPSNNKSMLDLNSLYKLKTIKYWVHYSSYKCRIYFSKSSVPEFELYLDGNTYHMYQTNIDYKNLRFNNNILAGQIILNNLYFHTVYTHIVTSLSSYYKRSIAIGYRPKIYVSKLKNGFNIRVFQDLNPRYIRNIFKNLNISYKLFIRLLKLSNPGLMINESGLIMHGQIVYIPNTDNILSVSDSIWEDYIQTLLNRESVSNNVALLDPKISYVDASYNGVVRVMNIEDVFVHNEDGGSLNIKERSNYSSIALLYFISIMFAFFVCLVVFYLIALKIYQNFWDTHIK